MYNPAIYYSVFHFVVFVIRPIFAYYYNYDSLYYAYQFLPSQSDKITVILASNLGFIAFVLLCQFKANVSMAFSRSTIDYANEIAMAPSFVWAWIICSPLAAYSAYKSIGSVQAGVSSSGMIFDRATGISINTMSNGYVSDAQFMFVALTAALAFFGRFRPWSLLPLIMFVAYRFSTGGRVFAIYALTSAILMYSFHAKIKMPSFKIIIFIILGLLSFRAIGDDRGLALRQLAGIEEKDDIFVEGSKRQTHFLESMDYANMEFFEYLVYVVPSRSHTYDFFIDNAQVFSDPIPRVIWKDKPIGEPFRRISLWDYGSPIGMTRSLPGEGWYALGWPGVLLWCGLWGFICGSIYQTFSRGPKTIIRIVAYMLFLTSLIGFFRDGVLVSLVRQDGVMLVPLVVWFGVAKFTGVIRRLRLASENSMNLAVPRQPLSAVKNTGKPAAESNRSDATPRRHVPPAVVRRRIFLESQSDKSATDKAGETSYPLEVEAGSKALHHADASSRMAENQALEGTLSDQSSPIVDHQSRIKIASGMPAAVRRRRAALRLEDQS
jgi:hypothetical protein